MSDDDIGYSTVNDLLEQSHDDSLPIFVKTMEPVIPESNIVLGNLPFYL